MDGLRYSINTSPNYADLEIDDAVAYLTRTRADQATGLPQVGLSIQTVVTGSAMVPFGHRLARLDEQHFRVGFKQLPAPQGDDHLTTELLTLAIPADCWRSRFGGALRHLDMETLDQIRLPLKSSLQSHFNNLKQIARRGQVVPLVDVESVYSVLTVLEQDIIDMLRRLDCLPGRSLFKRADLFMRLEAANDHIETHFIDDPSTPFLAEISHISRAHFIRLFSSFYGTSPKQMTLSRKLQEARRLMRETGWSVAEVASKSGFCNRCAFQRLFKERTGVTPLQYRRQSTELIQQSLANTFARRHTRPRRQATIPQKVGLWTEH